MVHNQRYPAAFPTEPFASRLAAKSRSGDSTVQHLFVNAAAWGSALRTARIRGEDWGIDGPE